MNQSSSIWAGGKRSYLEALKAEEEKVINSLQKKLLHEKTEEEKSVILAQIEETKSEFLTRRDVAKEGLFFS